MRYHGNMKLEEALKMVREENLTKTQLEDYHTKITDLFIQLQLECADKEKEEALFMSKKEPHDSVAQMKIFWRASAGGQRLIVLKRYISATSKMLDSIKRRLYLIY